MFGGFRLEEIVFKIEYVYENILFIITHLSPKAKYSPNKENRWDDGIMLTVFIIPWSHCSYSTSKIAYTVGS